MRIVKHLACIAMMCVAAQPCMAADDRPEREARSQRMSAFGGLHISMATGGRAAARPSARLRLGTTRTLSDIRSGTPIETYHMPGLELGLNASRRPTLFVAGQSSAQMRERLKIGGSTGTILLIGGVVLVVAVLATVASATPTPGPPPGAFD